MKIVHIADKLESIGVSPGEVNLGDFDRIAEFTAKRERSREEQNYKKYGCFYRSNYERGILVYYLIKQLEIKSLLEIGFGRGYVSFCAAKAFHDLGVTGKIVSIDPGVDERYQQALRQVLPQEWFSFISLMKGTSEQILPQLQSHKFDLVYIDGDHSYQATKHDWEMTKNLFEKCALFDDYHMKSKNDPGIQCSQAIDEIDWQAENCLEPELIRMDRRMFADERKFTDEQIDYGQVLLTKSNVSNADW